MDKKLNEVLDIFESSFQGLRETANLVLAVAATTRLERKQPLAVILVGGPSSGKTSVLMPLTRGEKGSRTNDQVLRVDDFSGASLVSHAANKTAEQLAKQDLLPKMKDKCVVVKEMAPLFTGHEDELLRKFGMFASVLDGEGYTSSSGSHGNRGYTEKILFSLLGAVTPNVLTAKVMAVLDSVGPRFCFWEVPNRNIDPTNWKGPDNNRAEVEAEATNNLTRFLEALFTKHDANSLSRVSFSIPEEKREKLSLIALTMATLRSRGVVDKDDEGNVLGYTFSQESPERAFRYLEQIVLGSALINDRFKVENDDLKLALGVAIGSIPPAKRKVIKALIESQGKMTIREISRAIKMNTDTAAKYVEYVEKSSLVEKVNVDGTTEWDLKMPFKDLRSIHNPNLIQTHQIQELWDKKEPSL